MLAKKGEVANPEKKSDMGNTPFLHPSKKGNVSILPPGNSVLVSLLAMT